MLFSKSVFALLAATISSAAAKQVALYWGQNGALGQERLSYYCQEQDVDIILLSFLNDFPDPTNVNFANQCGATFDSGLLHCSQIGEDIKGCQAAGKKVILSLGGAAGNYGFTDGQEATDYAETLWNKFGPTGSDDERPFDDAVVDGFDFDIELGTDVGYPQLATALRSKFASDSSKSYYLSAAPQCPYPDALLDDLFNQVSLDYAFIQFYNNPCSIDGQFNFENWSQHAESFPNPNIELFVGVPATDNIAGYATPSQLASAIDDIKCDPRFGGVSLWDASGAWKNTNSDGQNFVEQVKQVLDEHTCSASSSSSSSSSSSETSTVESTSESSVPAEPTDETESAVPTSDASSSSSSSSVVSSTGYYNSTIPQSSSTIESTAIDTTSSSSSSSSSVAAITTTTDAASASVDPTGSTSASSEGDHHKDVSASTQGGLSTVTDISKTIVTITSCENHVCTKVPVETGVVVVTDIDTVYTTYCPLTASEVVIPVKTKTVAESSATTEASAVAPTKGAESSASAVAPTKGAESSASAVASTKGAESSAPAVAPTKGAESSAPAVTIPSSSIAGPASTKTPVVVESTSVWASVVAPSSGAPAASEASTEYYTVVITSTVNAESTAPAATSPVSAAPAAPSIVQYTNGTTNGTAPINTPVPSAYEGAANSNGVTLWLTVPLMFVAALM